MRKRRLVFAAMLLLGPLAANATLIDLFATKTASPRVNLGGVDTNADNRLRAYDTGFGEIDGFIGFDLSAIPDLATINSMVLTLYAEGGPFGAPFNSPEIQIRRSALDSWTRGGSGFPTTYDEVLTGVDSGPFSSTRGTAYSFILDVGAVSWSTDLADDFLSLVLDEVSLTTNDFMYFFGSDPVSATGLATDPGTFFDWVPRLSVDYTIASVPEPGTLALLGIGLFGMGLARRRRKV